jgi:DNA-binding LytR/AlgR family response regulator
MKILIFTQDKELLNILREETKKVLLKGRQEAKIISFSLLSSTINELSANSKDYDLVVLDIDYLQELKNIYKSFRVKNFLASIIIISSSYKYLDSAMLLRPTAYLKKPLAEMQYSSKVKFVMEELLSLDRFFNFKQKQSLERIPYSDIEYFESSQRNVSLYIRSNAVHTFTAKLDDIETKVPNIKFVRCHKSYLVNMENVKFFDKVNKQFQMESGRYVDISRRSMPEVAEKFQQFTGSRG